MVTFTIINPIDPINPSKTLSIHNQIQICSDASEKNLTSQVIFYATPMMYVT